MWNDPSRWNAKARWLTANQKLQQRSGILHEREERNVGGSAKLLVKDRLKTRREKITRREPMWGAEKEMSELDPLRRGGLEGGGRLGGREMAAQLKGAETREWEVDDQGDQRQVSMGTRGSPSARKGKNRSDRDSGRHGKWRGKLSSPIRGEHEDNRAGFGRASGREQLLRRGRQPALTDAWPLEKEAARRCWEFRWGAEKGTQGKDLHAVLRENDQLAKA